jgi:4-hydroxythreonine-4-phosphate dehydrogenase
MKVFVTQGHEKGIGLEVFFKTFLLLTESERKHLQLIAFRPAVEDTLRSLNVPFEISERGLRICSQQLNVEWLKKTDFSQSHSSLEAAMELSDAGGVLYTLPTSKDQFKSAAGHTEYFRKKYKTPDLGMFFSSPELQVLLLTDHVSIKELSHLTTEDMIYRKLSHNLETLKKWDWPLDKILVAGLNPHAGEGGMIGDEDNQVKSAIKRLINKRDFAVSGPYPGDTMLLEKKSRHDLLVYLFHDQGLGVFKGLQGFIGSNITLGLPYPRLSPDHGTSFSLYGKNLADYRGCAFSLRQALELLTRTSHGQNSGHQSQST